MRVGAAPCVDRGTGVSLLTVGGVVGGCVLLSCVVARLCGPAGWRGTVSVGCQSIAVNAEAADGAAREGDVLDLDPGARGAEPPAFSFARAEVRTHRSHARV